MGGNRTGHSDPSSTEQPPLATGPREDDAIYQDSRIVARAIDARVDREAREIHFGELHHSDYLLLPEECEFQNYKIMVQRVGYAAREEKGSLDKGRILREVTADILGYREQ